jgi:hypothetical protein
MIKKFFAKLVGWQEQRENVAERIHDVNQREHRDLAAQRHDQIMHERGDKKYVSERTSPDPAEILGPSEEKEDK